MFFYKYGLHVMWRTPNSLKTQVWVKVENSGKKRSRGTLPNSQHFEG
jgi:hypothetical protein